MSGRFIFVALLVALLGPARTWRSKEYTSGNKDKVVVFSAHKTEASDESRLEFFYQGQMRCRLNYSSASGEHGYGVEKASWTADGNYFVFSLSSSGGHQGWHSPTLAYGRLQSVILYLDDFSDSGGISDSQFLLEPPNIIKTRVLRDRDVSIRLNLDVIFKKAGAGKGKSTSCSGGRLVVAGPK